MRCSIIFCWLFSALPALAMDRPFEDPCPSKNLWPQRDPLGSKLGRYYADSDAGQIAADYPVTELAHHLGCGSNTVRICAAKGLSEHPTTVSESLLLGALRDASQEVRSAAHTAILRLWEKLVPVRDAKQIFDLTRALEHEDHSTVIQRTGLMIARNPELTQAYWLRGQSYAAKREFELAIRDYRRVLELNPHRFDAAVALGTLLLDQSDTGQAIRSFRQAAQTFPQMPGLMQQIDVLNQEIGTATPRTTK